MAIQNALNLVSTGIVTHDGAGIFTGSTVTEGGVLLGGAANSVVDTGVLAKGTTIVGDGATAPTLLAVGTDGQVLEADSTEASGVKWATPTLFGTPSPVDVNTISYYTDFMQDIQTSYPFITTGASKVTSNANKDTPGIIALSGSDSVLVTSASGEGDFVGGGAITMFSRGTMDGTVSVTPGTTVFFGFMDGSGISVLNRVGFIYNPALGATWRTTTSNGGNITYVDTGIPMTNGGVWQTFKIEIDAAGTQAEFFLNGVSLGIQSANFPPTTVRMRIGWILAGWPASYNIDYYGYNQVMTLDRS